jgi:predicted SprT family Zn-dependent metalloprotease
MDDYLVYQCRCGRIATLELRLPNYVRMYSCGECERSFRRVYREAEFRKLTS